MNCCSKCGKATLLSVCFSCLQNEIDEKKKSNNNVMYINEIPKLEVKYNYKTPIKSKWELGNDNKLKPCSKYNAGIICNKRSGVIAVDLDFYDKKGKEKYDPINNPNHKLFIDLFGTNYIETFNTYTQKTPNGGIHLIFKHHDKFKQTSNEKFKIDTRGGNTNGYVVMAGSKINGKKYQVINDTDIKDIPQELLKFLEDNVFDNQGNKVKQKTNKFLNNKLVKYQTKYIYNVPNENVEDIINKLPKDYFTDLKKWFMFTCAMKQINKKSLWDKYSKEYGGEKYNKDKNLKTWLNIKIKADSFYFEYLLKIIKCAKDIRYYRYLDVPKQSFKDFKHIDIDKLSKKLKLDNDKNYCIKSDTGTGKTTLFKKFIKEHQDKFISITSRRCLAFEQYEDFLDIVDDEVNYYEYGLYNNNVQGCTICIDSILKIKDWDFTNRIVFLDEFNSIIEYILSTPTMAKIRDEIFNTLFDKILNEAKMILCVDADISDLSIHFLKEFEKSRNIKFNYIQNDYIHNKSTKSTEIKEHEDFIHKICNEEMFLLTCDSRKQAINLYEQITKYDEENNTDREPIKLIVAEDKEQEEEFVRLNKHKRIIFSPKVIYGLDSNGYGDKQLPRPVYSYYDMKTISPSNMLQQINRERKITEHYYFIYTKCVNNDIILEEEEYKLNVMNDNKLALKLFDNNIHNKLFCELLYLHEYKQNCYNSNKYLHFRKLLEQRGFVLTNNDLKIGKRSKDLKQEKALNVRKYIDENYKLTDLLKCRVNENLLHIYNTEHARKYKTVITDNFAISQYINTKYLFFANESVLVNKLENNNDFSIIKMTSNINQIIFVRKVMKLFAMNNNLEFEEHVELNENEMKSIVEEYKHLFRDNTKKDIELKTEYDRIKFVAGKCFKKLNIPIITKKVKRNGKVIIDYQLDKAEMKLFSNIYQYTKRYYNNLDIKYLEECDKLNSKMCELKTDINCKILEKVKTI